MKHHNLKCESFLVFIGQFLKECRVIRGEKLSSVSSSLGLTHPVISRIENGRYDALSIKLFIRLIEYYDISFVELLVKVGSYYYDDKMDTHTVRFFLNYINSVSKQQ